MSSSITRTHHLLRLLLVTFLTFTLLFTTSTTSSTPDPRSQIASDFFTPKSSHSNNWAVLVCTSRFWFNYRHIANTLSFYHIVKQMGIPDDHIILMLADDVACNPRNSYPAQIFNNANRKINLYADDVEVDYRGYEVTVESFIRLLTGRHDKNVPLSKRLRTNEESNVLIYLTGHGGNEFLKFQDAEEISAMDLADAVHQMHEKKRYHELLLMVDTCQAGTMFNRIYSPGVVAVGSSQYAENSYSHHSNFDVGVAIIDRFTYFTLEFFERQHLYRGDSTNITMRSQYSDHQRRTTTLGQMFRYYNPHEVMSHPVFRTDLSLRDVDTVPLTDFFAQDIKIDFTQSVHPLRDVKAALSSSVDDLDEDAALEEELLAALTREGATAKPAPIAGPVGSSLPLYACLGALGVLLAVFTSAN